MIIEVKGVSKAFGELSVLDGVSFTASPDAPVAVTGASGSGKTTLMRIIMGLEKPDAGSVTFSPAPAKLRFGAVFQEDRLFDELDAAENVRLACGGIKRADAERELLRLLPEDALQKPVGLLSGGQRRRVAIVRALMAKADVIVMDEPFSGLDRQSAEAAEAYIREKLGSRALIMAVHERDIPGWCSAVSLD